MSSSSRKEKVKMKGFQDGLKDVRSTHDMIAAGGLRRARQGNLQ